MGHHHGHRDKTIEYVAIEKWLSHCLKLQHLLYRPRFDTPSKNELLGFAVTEYQ